MDIKDFYGKREQEIAKVKPHIEIPPELQKREKYCNIQRILKNLKKKN